MCNENNYNEVMRELAEMKAMQNEIAAGESSHEWEQSQ